MEKAGIAKTELREMRRMRSMDDLASTYRASVVSEHFVSPRAHRKFPLHGNGSRSPGVTTRARRRASSGSVAEKVVVTRASEGSASPKRGHASSHPSSSTATASPLTGSPGLHTKRSQRKDPDSQPSQRNAASTHGFWASLEQEHDDCVTDQQHIDNDDHDAVIHGSRSKRASVPVADSLTPTAAAISITKCLERLLLNRYSLSFLTAFVSGIQHVADDSACRVAVRSVVHVTHAYGLVSNLLKLAVTEELVHNVSSDTTDDHLATLFRAASPASDCFRHYVFHVGSPKYLVRTVRPLVSGVLRLAKDRPVELDPALCDATAIGDFIVALDELIGKFLHSLHNNSFRVVMAHLAQETRRLCPAMFRSVMSVFVFLRFLCPAVVMPVQYEVIKSPPSPSGRRALLLMSKILANVGSGVLFDPTKQQFMCAANPIIKRWRSTVTSLFNTLAEWKEKPRNSPWSQPSPSKPKSDVKLQRSVLNIVCLMVQHPSVARGAAETGSIISSSSAAPDGDVESVLSWFDEPQETPLSSPLG